jgi:hypothetical protein
MVCVDNFKNIFRESRKPNRQSSFRLNTEREFPWRWRASRGMLLAEKENRAVSECEVKVTRNAAATGEPIRKRFTRIFHRAGLESRAQRPSFV